MNDNEFSNFNHASEAIRDVLFMYKALIEYSGLYDDFGTEDGKFEPEIFVNCKASEYSIDEDDARLLHEGSAIKLICSVYQAWSQGGYPIQESLAAEKAKHILNEGKINHMPELEAILKIALYSCEDARPQFNLVFEKYVKGYFKSLIEL